MLVGIADDDGAVEAELLMKVNVLVVILTVDNTVSLEVVLEVVDVDVTVAHT